MTPSWAAASLAGLIALGAFVACTSATPTPTPARSVPMATSAHESSMPTDSRPTSSPQPTFGVSTGSADVVLRMARQGGFLYPGTTLDEPPVFTLYGDGRVIYTVEVTPPDGRVVRELHAAQLTADQITALVGNALDGAGLRTARERYSDVPMADGTTTTFEFNADGVRKTVSVYALGEYDEPGPDAAARAKFEDLAQHLRTFAAEVEVGNVDYLGRFEPSAYRVTIFPVAEGEFPPSADWPWPSLEPADFEVDNSGFGSRTMAATDGELVTDLRAAEVGDPIVSGPDDNLYLLRARALLPDETPVPPPAARATAPAVEQSVAIVLRLTVYEFPTAVTKVEAPEFTLYDDGLAIYTVKSRPPGSTWDTYVLHEAQLNPDQAHALVLYALDNGGLRHAGPEYNIANAVDMEWNYFHVLEDGNLKEVRVYGLSSDAAPDTAARAKFAAIADRLLNFQAEIEAGHAAYVGLHEPMAYEATIRSGGASDHMPVNAEWPWPDIAPSDFKTYPDGGLWLALTPEQGHAVLDLGIDEYLIAEAPDGERYVIRVQPLLPDETPGPILD